jgi:hypothetical protein
LSGLLRYASANGIEAPRRLIARAWNACVANVAGWPSQRLIEPPIKSLTQIPWEAFPEGLRADIEQHLSGFNKIRRRAMMSCANRRSGWLRP